MKKYAQSIKMALHPRQVATHLGVAFRRCPRGEFIGRDGNIGACFRFEENAARFKRHQTMKGASGNIHADMFALGLQPELVGNFAICREK